MKSPASKLTNQGSIRMKYTRNLFTYLSCAFCAFECAGTGADSQCAWSDPDSKILRSRPNRLMSVRVGALSTVAKVDSVLTVEILPMLLELEIIVDGRFKLSIRRQIIKLVITFVKGPFIGLRRPWKLLKIIARIIWWKAHCGRLQGLVSNGH